MLRKSEIDCWINEVPHKLGRHGKLFMWLNDAWVRSNKSMKTYKQAMGLPEPVSVQESLNRLKAKSINSGETLEFNQNES